MTACPARVSPTAAAAARMVSVSPVQGRVSRAPGQSLHQNAITATAGSAYVAIGPRISSEVVVLPMPRARAKNPAVASSRPPSPAQGWAASRSVCKPARRGGRSWGGGVPVMWDQVALRVVAAGLAVRCRSSGAGSSGRRKSRRCRDRRKASAGRRPSRSRDRIPPAAEQHPRVTSTFRVLSSCRYRPLVRPALPGRRGSAFARELEADVPQVVAAVHVAGIGLGQVPRGGAGIGFFHYDVGAAVLAGDQQPGVVGALLVAGAVPADAGVRDVLGDGASDLEAERGPVED